MGEQKALTPEEKAKVMPVVQGAMQTYEQRYGMKLTEAETNRIVDRALDNLKSRATQSEVKGAVRDQMFALLIEKDPGRAIDLRMQIQNVDQSERERIHAVAEEQGFKAANKEIARLESSPTERAPEEKRGGAPKVAARGSAQREEGKAEIVRKKAQEEKAARGVTIIELYTNALETNNLLLEKFEKYRAEIEKIDYPMYPAEVVQKKRKATQQEEAKHEQEMRAYKAKVEEVNKKYEPELNAAKERRDRAVASYVKAAAPQLVPQKGENLEAYLQNTVRDATSATGAILATSQKTMQTGWMYEYSKDGRIDLDYSAVTNTFIIAYKTLKAFENRRRADENKAEG